MIDNTKHRMDRAFTAFSAACVEVGAAVKAKAKADAELFSAFVEIGLGFLLPGLSKGLGALLGKIPVTVNDETKQILDRVFLNLSNGDAAKALIQGATKLATTEIKQHAVELFGDVEVNHFINNLQVQFQSGFQRTEEDLYNRSLAEVTALCAAFDSGATNVVTYIAAVNNLIGHYEKEVAPIRTTTYADRTVKYDVREVAYWVRDQAHPSKGRWLAVCHRLQVEAAKATTQFVTWVSPEMREMALQKTAVALKQEDPHSSGKPPEIEIHELDATPSRPETVPNDPATCVRQ